MLRNALPWELGAYQERPESKSGIPCPPALQAYDLGDLAQRASALRYREVLTYLHWLEHCVQSAPESFSRLARTTSTTVRWLDVGAKNWAYVDALDTFVQRHFPKHDYRVDGLELDPHRRYADFRTRAQAARAFCAPLPRVQYHAGNALDWTAPATIVSQFLPFVYPEPLLAWGLPMRYFQPRMLLDHLLARLPAHGILVVVNQGEVEAEAQAELFTAAAQQESLHYQCVGTLPTPLLNYQYPRIGWICVKTAS